MENKEEQGIVRHGKRKSAGGTPNTAEFATNITRALSLQQQEQQQQQQVPSQTQVRQVARHTGLIRGQGKSTTA
eukprot:1159878-Pelagomonas_calceolata.AAC.17